MISWIQQYFQKHFKLVFFLLIAVMAIPMIFIYSASGGLGTGRGSGPEIELFGYSFSDQQARERLNDAAGLSGALSRSPLTSQPTERVALKYYADLLGIPQPTSAQLEQFIRTRPMFLGYDGQYNAQAYQQFRDNLRANLLGVSEAEVQRVLREDWRLAQVEKALQGPGYVVDAEVKRSFDDRESTWTVETASLDLSTVQVTAEPSEEEIRNWFESQLYRYEIPRQVVVNYVEFTPASFMTEVKEPTDEEIVAHFTQNKARYQKKPEPAADGSTPPPPVETTLEDVRPQVRDEVIQAKAAAVAALRASEFATLLYNNEIVPDTEAFQDLIQKHQLVVKSAPPFAENEIPAGLPWETTTVNAAFRLSERNPVSDSLRIRDGGSVILFFKSIIEKQQVELAQVRDRVIADVRAEKRNLAITVRGEELHRQLSTAVATGTSFSEAAKAAGMEVKSWEKFKLTAPPPDLNPVVYQNLSQLKEREVSQMSRQGDRGTFVFISARERPDPAVETAAYNQVRLAVMEQFAELGARVAVDEIVRREKAAAGLPEDDR